MAICLFFDLYISINILILILKLIVYLHNLFNTNRQQFNKQINGYKRTERNKMTGLQCSLGDERKASIVLLVWYFTLTLNEMSMNQ